MKLEERCGIIGKYQSIGHFEFIVNSLEDFNTNYDTILSKDIVTDLGLRFADGLALLDGGVMGEPHQYSRHRYIIYAKAFGYSWD